MSDHELAYCVIVELAVAQATLANIFRSPRRKPYKPEEFLLQLRPKASSLRQAMEAARQWAADLPIVVQQETKRLADETSEG